MTPSFPGLQIRVSTQQKGVAKTNPLQEIRLSHPAQAPVHLVSIDKRKPDYVYHDRRINKVFSLYRVYRNQMKPLGRSNVVANDNRFEELKEPLVQTVESYRRNFWRS